MKVYERVYNYYIEQMQGRSLLPGDRMPSLRECERSLSVSRTSAETAYMQLAADGYIYSVEKVGFFVTDLAARNWDAANADEYVASNTLAQTSIKYDFATIGEDKTISCLELWRRYMKSALRQEERLLSYASNQGEEDLREEIVGYVRKTRNIICSQDDIVIGAGFQNLLQIMIPLFQGQRHTISFPTKSFADGAAIFANAGYSVSYRDKTADIIYVTPAYMTKWGAVMTVKRRQELLEHGRQENHFVIEDDYQNEFVFSNHATPSIYALSGGEGVAYLGSFSRVLLPSVRISFLILPRELRDKYAAISHLYNQTASKAEQIALAQFIRDGHLIRHIKKMHRLYEEKREIMINALQLHMNANCHIYVGDSGMEIGIGLGIQNLKNWANQNHVDLIELDVNENESRYLLSCGRIPEEEIEEGIMQLSKCLL